MRAPDADPRRRFVAATATALILHAVLLAPAAYLLPDSTGARGRRPLAVSLFDGSTGNPAGLAYEPEEPIPEGQVVDVPPAGTARPVPDEHARFLSESGQTVERETHAAVRVAGEHGVSSAVSAPGARTGPRPRPGVVGPARRGIGSRERMAPRDEFVMIVPERSGTGAPGPDRTGAGDVPASGVPSAAESVPRPATTLEGGRDGTSPVPPGDLLAPTVQVLADAVAGTAMDYLEGVEEGEATALSARPFRHASFYRRVRDQVAQYWDPGGAFDVNDPYGRHYGYRDRETVVLVTLDCSGSLMSASLLEESGARFLDEEAVTAIEQGAPFYNPPRELCDERRSIITFTFGFYVETDDGPQLRVRMTR